MTEELKAKLKKDFIDKYINWIILAIGFIGFTLYNSMPEIKSDIQELVKAIQAVDAKLDKKVDKEVYEKDYSLAKEEIKDLRSMFMAIWQQQMTKNIKRNKAWEEMMKQYIRNNPEYEGILKRELPEMFSENELKNN